MIQFYKKRNFGSLIGDTFTFFKENGKNYFKNYILLNGILLIILVALFVISYRLLFSEIFYGNIEGYNYYSESYFKENSTVFVGLLVLFFILFFGVLILNYCYPVFYMKRLSENGNKNIKADEILSDVKANFGRIIIFVLGMTFVVIPLSFIVFGVSYLLIFILVGFLFLLLIIPVMTNICNFILFDYLHTKRSFFSSLSYCIRVQFGYQNGSSPSPFWKYWGSTIVMGFIVQTIVSVFTMIPMFIGFVSVFSSESAGNSSKFFEGTMGVIFFISYGLVILFSFILMNFLYVNIGLMYYDSRTDLHQKMDLSEIENIGNAQ